MEVKYAVAKNDGGYIKCKTIDGGWVDYTVCSDIIEWYASEDDAKAGFIGFDCFALPSHEFTLEDKLSTLKELCNLIYCADLMRVATIGAISVSKQLFDAAGLIDVIERSGDSGEYKSGTFPGTDVLLISNGRV